MYQHSVKSYEPEPTGWMCNILSFQSGDLNIFTRSVGQRVLLSLEYSDRGFNLKQQPDSG